MVEIEEEMIECECCGMSEECTPKYISRVKAFFCGKWVCGLCSEAVKEQVRKNPAASLQEALESHMALCMKFHRTIRANPKLSFASSMRDIAKRSSQRRTSNSFFGVKMEESQAAALGLISRSTVPRFSETFASCWGAYELQTKDCHVWKFVGDVKQFMNTALSARY
ncbi:unnamed protein product [Spirodela intermedia]|uniref:Uncharacterized protein n=1 Tax=Spirodela intermedia TaxID=51605 RepID=A0A7I8J7K0_SPIIN|nr:unnamed protein product [Spirodela intermedia]CAA6666041.1 unnamed protein product [Spirodela intermedia]